MLSSNRKSLIKENSNFSSNIQTESTSGISYTQIKNLKLLKYSIKRRNIKKSQNILKIPKLNLKTDIHNKKINHNANKNFLYSFSK
jgi:ribosomal protein L32